MIVRMIEGFYEQPGSPSDYFLKPVAFPLYVEDPRDDDELEELLEERNISAAFDAMTGMRIIRNHDELGEWAEEVFAEHNIFNMDIPPGAIVSDLREVT